MTNLCIYNILVFNNYTLDSIIKKRKKMKKNIDNIINDQSTCYVIKTRLNILFINKNCVTSID